MSTKAKVLREYTSKDIVKKLNLLSRKLSEIDDKVEQLLDPEVEYVDLNSPFNPRKSTQVKKASDN